MDCDGQKHSLVRDLDGQFVGTYPAEGSVVPFAELRLEIKTESLKVLIHYCPTPFNMQVC